MNMSATYDSFLKLHHDGHSRFVSREVQFNEWLPSVALLSLVVVVDAGTTGDATVDRMSRLHRRSARGVCSATISRHES